MSDALDNARAALAWWDQSALPPHRNVAPAINALRALIAEHERLTAPPTDDERETLAGAIRSHALTTHLFGKVSAEEIADVALAWFRRQGPVTVTDEMGERMARIHGLLSSLDLDSSITREGTAWGSILREALALSEADARAALSPDGNTRCTDGSTT